VTVLVAVMELIRRMSLVIFIAAIVFASSSLATWHSRRTGAVTRSWNEPRHLCMSRAI
jgi:hypothetical protein